MLWECLCFSSSVHSRTGPLTLGCPLHVFPKEPGPGARRNPTPWACPLAARPFRDVYFPHRTLARGDHCSHFIHESLRLAWKGHGRQAPAASSSLEKEED